MSQEDFAGYGRPRRVPGGLRARTARGAIGRSWWSRRFLDVLESFALGTRLTRGRAYARAGQVLTLEVAPGEVTASVQGSQVRPYRVRIGLDVFPDPVWSRVETLLAGQALFSARLLAGELPPDLEEVFAGVEAPLFPAAVGDLRMRCDCPDFAVPCKHLAATFYLLAEALDADPFQLLHWRGRTRDRLLSRLRALRTGVGSRVTPAPDDVEGTATTAIRSRPVAGAAASLADLPAPPSGPPDRFWLPPVPLPAWTPTPPTGPDLLLRQLGVPDPALGGPGLLERLRRAYLRFGGQPADGIASDRPASVNGASDRPASVNGDDGYGARAGR